MDVYDVFQTAVKIVLRLPSARFSLTGWRNAMCFHTFPVKTRSWLIIALLLLTYRNSVAEKSITNIAWYRYIYGIYISIRIYVSREREREDWNVASKPTTASVTV